MNDDPSKRDERSASARAIPQGFADQVLMDLFVEIQQDTRLLKQEYNIPTSGICAMARSAEEAISDTSVRATFLHLLIDLHEFGREVRRRGLLRKESSTRQSDPITSLEKNTQVEEIESEAAISQREASSRAFFDSLDDPVSSSA